jgi:hypothetical protein
LIGQTFAKVNLILVSAGIIFVGTFVFFLAWILLEVPFAVQLRTTLILVCFFFAFVNKYHPVSHWLLMSTGIAFIVGWNNLILHTNTWERISIERSASL